MPCILLGLKAAGQQAGAVEACLGLLGERVKGSLQAVEAGVRPAVSVAAWGWCGQLQQGLSGCRFLSQLCKACAAPARTVTRALHVRFGLGVAICLGSCDLVTSVY